MLELTGSNRNGNKELLAEELGVEQTILHPLLPKLVSVVTSWGRDKGLQPEAGPIMTIFSGYSSQV